jgi:nitrogen regulatory protein PII
MLSRMACKVAWLTLAALMPVISLGCKLRGITIKIKVGNVVYDNIPKTMLMMVADDDKLESAVKIIEDSARTGNIGDGKIFVSSVEEA